MKYTTSKSP